MADIARAANVSKNAVSLALRSDPQIPEFTRARIAAVAAKMGYVRNNAIGNAMSMVRRKGYSGSPGDHRPLQRQSDQNAFLRHPPYRAMSGLLAAAESLATRWIISGSSRRK
jgi:LacI family transcriptional regulator